MPVCRCKVNFHGSVHTISTEDVEALPDDPRCAKVPAAAPVVAGAGAGSAKPSTVTSQSAKTMVRHALQLEDCVVCMDAPACMTLVHDGTGHLCVCQKCSKSLRECPMCRKPVSTAVRTYFGEN